MTAATPVLRVLLVDDESLARDRLERLCRALDGVEVVGQAASGGEALEKAAELRPDVLLLDITMPGLDGLQTAQALDRLRPIPAVVFVTAHDGFAVRAFDVPAVDYLLKPVEADRLARALGRCRAPEDAPPSTADGERAFATEFWAPRRGSLVRVQADSLTHVEAERDYVRLHTGGDSFLIKSTLSNMVAELDPSTFIRTHRSFAVACSAVVSLEPGLRGEPFLRLGNGVRVPIGRSFLKEVRQRMRV